MCVVVCYKQSSAVLHADDTAGWCACSNIGYHGTMVGFRVRDLHGQDMACWYDDSLMSVLLTLPIGTLSRKA